MTRSIKDIAKTARTEIKKALPAWTFSLTQPHYGSLHLNLMSGPTQALIPTPDGAWANGYAQLNIYTFTRDFGYGQEEQHSNGAQLTPAAYDAIRKAVQIANAENWDRSDLQSDYFNVNYYLSVSVGKWDRPYTVSAA